MLPNPPIRPPLGGAWRPAGLTLAALALALAACPEDMPEPRAAPARVSPSPAETADDPVTPEEIARASASDRALEPARTDWSGGDPARGATLYARYCATCHGAAGAGDGPAAAALNPKPRDFRHGAFSFDADADAETGEPIDLARVIREGPAAFGGSDAMPAWSDVLAEDEIRDLVAYVRTLAGADAG